MPPNFFPSGANWFHKNKKGAWEHVCFNYLTVHDSVVTQNLKEGWYLAAITPYLERWSPYNEATLWTCRTPNFYKFPPNSLLPRFSNDDKFTIGELPSGHPKFRICWLQFPWVSPSNGPSNKPLNCGSQLELTNREIWDLPSPHFVAHKLCPCRTSGLQASPRTSGPEVTDSQLDFVHKLFHIIDIMKLFRHLLAFKLRSLIKTKSLWSSDHWFRLLFQTAFRLLVWRVSDCSVQARSGYLIQVTVPDFIKLAYLACLSSLALSGTPVGFWLTRLS